MSDISIIYTMFSAEDDALSSAKTLIEEGLVACANHLAPTRSQYMWGGKLCDEREFPVILKTSDGLLKRAMERLKQLHAYEAPAIISWRADAVDPVYERWLQDQLTA